ERARLPAEADHVSCQRNGNRFEIFGGPAIQEFDTFADLEALPIARPSGCSMSVIKTTIFVFIARHTSTMERESAVASFSVGMNAPEPVLTSITSPSSPSASFLLRMLAVIRGIDSTVPVTSRSA